MKIKLNLNNQEIRALLLSPLATPIFYSLFAVFHSLYTSEKNDVSVIIFLIGLPISYFVIMVIALPTYLFCRTRFEISFKNIMITAFILSALLHISFTYNRFFSENSTNTLNSYYFDAFFYVSGFLTALVFWVLIKPKKI